MKLVTYNRLLDRLNKQSDIQELAATTKYSEDFLLVLYSQKTVMNATKKYYKIKHQAPKIRSIWLKGKSFLDISKRLGFPPVLTALLILKEDGVSRKMFRKYLTNLDDIENKRLRKELKEVVANDIVYSPEGNAIQAERGQRGEDLIHKWLTDRNLKFQTEKELTDKYEKTPDFLLDEPLNVRGTDVHWIESKATFGNKSEIKKNIKNQLLPYRDLYGHGMVIYWFGFINPPPMVEGILIYSGKFIKEWKE